MIKNVHDDDDDRNEGGRWMDGEALFPINNKI